MKLTRAQLETAHDLVHTEAAILSLALSDALNGKIKWFGNVRTGKLGVSRETFACGGIVITHAPCGMTRAYYFEQYAQSELEHISRLLTGTDTEHNRELLRRRSVIEEAKAYVSAAQKAA